MHLYYKAVAISVKEKCALCSGVLTEHINIFCGKNAEFLMLNQVEYI
jgi:hypothetical protein